MDKSKGPQEIQQSFSQKLHSKRSYRPEWRDGGSSDLLESYSYAERGQLEGWAAPSGLAHGGFSSRDNIVLLDENIFTTERVQEYIESNDNQLLSKKGETVVEDINEKREEFIDNRFSTIKEHGHNEHLQRHDQDLENKLTLEDIQAFQELTSTDIEYARSIKNVYDQQKNHTSN